MIAPAMAGGSIFSGNGIGEQVVGGGTRAQGLAGGAFGFADSMSFNSENPALSAFTERTLLRMSGQVGIYETSSAGMKDTDGEFLWNDFRIYFPVMKMWRLGLGATPRNQQDLKLFANHTAIFSGASLDTVHYEERDVWTGGRTDLMLDNSFRLSEKLAVGLSTGYILLHNDRTRMLDMPNVPDHNYYLSASYDESETFRGFTFIFGGYYSVTPKLGIGASYRPRFNGHWDYQLTKAGSASESSNRDGKSPGEVDVGISYKLSQRVVGVADLQSGQWKKGDLGIIADSAGVNNPVNPLFVSLGFERLAGHPPQLTGFELWGYRGGLYYHKNYWSLVNGVPVEDFGATGGISIPVADDAGWLHVALEGGFRGRDEAKLGATETYWRASVQLEMSETWFHRTRPRIPK
jgi:hypothetical protein